MDVTDARAALRERHAREIAVRVFAVVSSKWGLRLLEEIAAGTGRFRALHRALAPISHRILTHTLRDLERHGLIARHDHRTANPRVDYTVTEAGAHLLTTVHGMCDWSRGYLDTLLDAPAHRAADEGRG
ncbi:winged helix-turn-helix transcriptional regulator [Nocardia takedensis]|uniref:winged helix-turn-helix transcriptional regulator n=1 Tax=Nocardia takedensis TaxID=259390 RepID=UPI0002D36E72|nr:helix-turn-helix domain-containing protein [Nocardia takedensis]